MKKLVLTKKNSTGKKTGKTVVLTKKKTITPSKRGYSRYTGQGTNYIA